MTQFSRRAKWLNILFPASSAPQVTDPGDRSDDVSLVQQYTGGGWGFGVRTVRNQLSGIGATGTMDLVSTGEDEVFYIGAVATLSFADDATQVVLNIRDDSGVPPRVAYIADPQIIIAAATPPIQVFDHKVKIMGPSSHLRIDWQNGQPGFQFNTTTYGILAPLGTPFFN